MEGVGEEDSKKIKRTIFDVAEEIFHQARKYFGNAENSKLERNAFISKIPPPPLSSSILHGSLDPFTARINFARVP